MGTQTDLAQRAVRFMEMMPQDSDNVIIILKGHLLIEEVLSRLLYAATRGSDPVRINYRDRSGYAQKLKICWALHSKELSIDIWTALRTMNDIRNRMAHSIEPKGIGSKISEFCDSVLMDSPFMNENYAGKELHFSIAWIYILVSQVLHDQENKEKLDYDATK